MIRDVTGGHDEWRIEVDHLTKMYPGGVEAVRGVSFTSSPARSSPCSARTAPASRRRSGCSRPPCADERLRAPRRPRRRRGPARRSQRLAASSSRSRSSTARLTGRREPRAARRLWRTPRPHHRRARDAFELDDLLDRPVESYSGGQRRRLEIARALSREPQVLFLDEPTVGLDPRIRHELLDVIAGLRNRGDMTLLLTTHYLDEAERLCDRVAIIHRGEDRRVRHACCASRESRRRDHRASRGGRWRAVLARMREHGVADATAFAVGST